MLGRFDLGPNALPEGGEPDQAAVHDGAAVVGKITSPANTGYGGYFAETGTANAGYALYATNTAAGTTGDGAPGSWGGHAVPVVAYDSRSLTVVTWGALQTMTWGFWAAYCDEAYAILSPDYLEQKGGQSIAPSGFNLTQLRDDLADLK